MQKGDIVFPRVGNEVPCRQADWRRARGFAASGVFRCKYGPRNGALVHLTGVLRSKE